MKVLLYFENADSIKKSGIGRAMRHQMEALTRAGVDFTIDRREKFDLAHINTLYTKSKKLLKKCNKEGIPVIVHGHSTYEDFRDSFALWKMMTVWFYPQLTYMYKHAGMIITPTEYSKKLIESYGFNKKVVAISNGISLEDYAQSEEKVNAFKKHFNITNEKVIIGIGLPFQRKGIHDFFEVARNYPDIKFIWFGHLASILVSRFVKKAIKHKPDNVIMPGYIDNDIIKGAMQYAELLLFPSYEETEGIVVLEALASKCPVLVRDIGVYEDWLTDGINCYKAKDNQGFKEKIDYIMSHDNKVVINNGYNLAKERNLSKVGEELKAIYTEYYNSVKK